MLTLRPRLLLLVLLAILPALGLAVDSGVQHRQAAADQAREGVQRLVRVLANQHEEELATAQQFLAALSQIPLVRGDNADACSELFTQIVEQSPQYLALASYLADGRVLCRPLQRSQPPEISSRPYFEWALQGMWGIGEYTADPAQGRTVLTFVYPVADASGQARKVLWMAKQLHWIEGSATLAGLPERSVVMVLDQDGTIVSHFPEPAQWIGKKADQSELLSMMQGPVTGGTRETVGADQLMRVFAFTPLRLGSDRRAGLFVGVPSSSVFAAADRILMRDVILLVLVAAVALLAAWEFGDLLLVRRINRILNAMQRIASGDLSARTGLVYGLGELSALARGFDQMAGSLQRQQAQLTEAEARYQALVEQTPAITYVSEIDAAGRIVYVSPQVSERLGFSPDEWVRDPEMWISQIHPDDRVRVVSDAARAGARGEPFTAEFRMLTRAGHVLWFHNQATPMIDQTGRTLYYQGILLDVTERRQAEEQVRRLNEELEQRVAARTRELQAANQELEAFSYSVSHDLRTPLAAAEGLVRLVAHDYAAHLPAEAQEPIRLVRQQLESMETLIGSLLAFSRASRQTLTKQPVMPGDIVRQVLEDLRPSIAGRRVEVVIKELPLCQADPRLLRQVWTNLISNAIKFTRNREIARIEIGSQMIGDESAYYVKDNGAGFPQEQADALFAVFRRLHTEEEYEGSGIGLAIVDRIVRRHGGRVWAEGQLEQGATFHFTLP